MTFPADEIILRLIKNIESQERGFKLLIQKYQRPVYWHVRRIVINHDDANDVTQEVFLKIWKNIFQFRKESKLFTWIYRIATNEALIFIKRKKRRTIFSMDNFNESLIDSISDDNYFNGDEIQEKLQRAIMQLPEKQKLVFNMKYFDELKYEEISGILKTSVGALKASYHLAVKKIEKHIKED